MSCDMVAPATVKLCSELLVPVHDAKVDKLPVVVIVGVLMVTVIASLALQLVVALVPVKVYVPAFGAVVTVAEPVATFLVVALVETQEMLPPSPLDAPVVNLT